MKKLMVLIVFIAACNSEPEVLVDYDRKADFENYKTFTLGTWQVKESLFPQYDNSLNRKRIMTAVERQLTGRGYVKDSLNPDFIVKIHLLINEKKEVSTYPTGPRYRYWQDYQVDVYDYEEGSLIIDLIDVKKDQLVWQGIVSGVLNISPEEVESAINSGVALIFSKYTYRAND